MSNPKHTPGPWSVALPSADGNYVIHRQQRSVAVVSRRAAPEDARNARLIAAAPDMLAALKAARERMISVGCTVRDADFRAVVDAIGKATEELT